MDTLKVPLSSVPDHGLAFEALVSGGAFQALGYEGPRQSAEPLRLESVRVKGTLSRVDDEYVFHGAVSGAYFRICDRCLDEAKASFRIEVIWTFAQGMGAATKPEWADDDTDEDVAEEEADATDIILFHGDEIDMAPRTWEEIVLNLPSKFVCRQDCRGLCPRCGVNLNRERCDCPQEDVEIEGADARLKNQGLAKLGEMFPELKAGRSEE